MFVCTIERTWTVLAAIAIACSCVARAESAERPNIVMIFTDDQGIHDVGCYGSEIETPRIDQIAEQGVRFTQFYAASSICTPSRFGLLTGRYPHRSRDALLGALMFLSDEDANRGIRPGEPTYVTLLAEKGYRTALIGKWHLGHGRDLFWPTEHGFDSFFGHTGGCVDFFTLRYGNRADWYRDQQIVAPDGYATDVITDEAIRFLDHHDPAQPFYLHLAYNAPHFGKAWDSTSDSTVNVMQPKPADSKRVPSEIDNPLRRSFAAKVIGLDQSVGRILDRLKTLSLADQTLVIFMTDHGGDEQYGGSNVPFRGGKATLFEGGIRVPCLVRWPGVVAPATECDAVACAIDWFPTFCELLGIGTGGFGLDGQSILHLLDPSARGQRSDERILVWRTSAHAELGRQSWRAVRAGDWKWVRPPDEDPMLFDLAADPAEQLNVADQFPDVAGRLRDIAHR
jgi:arylsulfatase A-like enzyme